MTMPKRLRLAISLAPFLGALAFAIPAQAAPPSGGQHHFEGGGMHGDFHRDFRHDHDHDRFGFGFGFGGFWDPWWDWWPTDYWGYPYYYPYYYPPYPPYGGSPAAGYPAAPGPATGAPGQASVAPPPQYWYFCDNPQGYYPYVQNCSTTWKQVAATPPSGSVNTISPKP